MVGTVTLHKDFLKKRKTEFSKNPAVVNETFAGLLVCAGASSLTFFTSFCKRKFR